MRKVLAGLIVSGAALTAGAANAATAIGNFNVKITITANCTVSATDMLFASTGVIAANVDQTSVISVICTNTTPYQIGIEAGSNGTVAARKMKNLASGEFISYSLFSDSGRLNTWGNTALTGWQTNTGNGSTTPQNFTVYGRVPVQTTPTPGNYTDIVQVTVNY